MYEEENYNFYSGWFEAPLFNTPHTWVNEGIVKLLQEKNIIITTYNYIINEFMRRMLFRRMNTSLDKVILIVDEAHNLHRVALHPESQSISIELLKKAGEEAKQYDEELAFSLMNLYNSLREKELKSNEEILLPREMFETIDFSKCFHYGEDIQEERIIKGETPVSYLLSIADFIELTSKDTIISMNVDKILEALQLKRIEIFNKVYSSVSISATIKPFEAYVKLCNLPENKTIAIETPYPFPTSNFKVFLLNDITTRYKERNEILYYKIYKIISSTFPLMYGGVLVAFPSYELLENFQKYIEDKNYKFDALMLIERKWMNSIEIHALYNEFIDKALNSKAYLFCVMGGRLSEGVDYIANAIKIVAIIGIPYPKPTEKTMMLLKFYEKLFGKKGKLYGYVIPAIWSALQAAGRGIRGPNDVCMIIFADKRYLKLKKLLPTWISENISFINIERLEDEVDNSVSMLY